MNIYDIAKLSGVSIATVSRVVNGSSKVSQKTKDKVLSVMKEQAYTPNVFARGLGLDSMKTVGIICPNIADQYMSHAVACLESELHQYGYDCILGCSGYQQEEKENYVRLMLSKRIDTLVLVGSSFAGDGSSDYNTDYIRTAAEDKPIFMINGRVEGSHIYCACADDYHATFEVTKKLIERGKKDILFMFDSESFSARQKMAGYEGALKEAGYPIRGQLKFRTKNEIAFTKDLLLSHRDLSFDSVVATDDGIAVGALKYARARGIRVPEELSIVGYNNSILATGCEPELTSIDSRLETLCRMTVAHMIRVLDRESNRKDTKSMEEEQLEHFISVPCEIKKRCTTDF